MENELVSIIIPIYNIEIEYLKECLDSVINQTYKNIEIILVDDGSSNEIYNKLDEIKEIDSRIRVFHKENGGVSSARNFGFHNSKGSYISFIDADDILYKDMIELLMKNIKSANAEISICGYLIRHLNKKVTYCNNTKKIRILNREDAISEFLEDNTFGVSVWNKLFRRSLIEDIKFDENYRVNEDRLYLIKAITNSNTIIYEDVCKYEYIKRKESTTNIVDSRKLDVIKVNNEIENILSQYKQFENILKINQVIYLIRIYNSYMLDNRYKENKSTLKNIKKEIMNKNVKLKDLNKNKKIYLEYFFLKYLNSFYRVALKTVNRLR